MLRAILSHDNRIRFALWALDLAFPSSNVLKRRFRNLLLGVVAAVASGVLAACSVAALVLALGYSLYRFAEFSPVWAILATAVTVLMVMVGLFYYGRSRFREAFSFFEGKESPSRAIHEEDTLREVMNGFIDGLFKPATAKPSPTAPDAREQYVMEKEGI